MPSIVNTNINSLTAQRQLSSSQNALSTSMARLSSGLRINTAKDDAAGLNISERFTSQIRGLNQAVRNTSDGISLAQTAEGALGSVNGILQRVRELAVQSANATNSSSDRLSLNNEVGQLTSELDRIAQATQFNGQNLFDGSFGAAVYQVGANVNQTITAASVNVRTAAYGNNQVAGTNAGVSSGTAGGFGTNGITAGTLAVSGFAGSANVTVALSDTAAAIATSINAQKGSTGVSATAQTDVSVSFQSVGNYSFNIASNTSTTSTVNFNVSAIATADGLSNAAAAINDQTSKTGVVAVVNALGTALTLSNSNGADIVLSKTATQIQAGSVTSQKLNANGTTVAGTAALTTTASVQNAITSGYLTLDSEKSFGVTATTTNALATSTSSLNTVAAIDVSTIAGANQAIKTTDSALSLVNGQRAKFGALQSRFEATINNLSVSSENLSASRSRIQDADFATETASLSRAQILQQAGTAMVAQANQLPQGVLALLRG
jgi:flagellin